MYVGVCGYFGPAVYACVSVCNLCISSCVSLIVCKKHVILNAHDMFLMFAGRLRMGSDGGGVGRQKWWQIGEESGDGRGDRGGSRYRR